MQYYLTPVFSKRLHETAAKLYFLYDISIILNAYFLIFRMLAKYDCFYAQVSMNEYFNKKNICKHIFSISIFCVKLKFEVSLHTHLTF